MTAKTSYEIPGADDFTEGEHKDNATKHRRGQRRHAEENDIDKNSDDDFEANDTADDIADEITTDDVPEINSPFAGLNIDPNSRTLSALEGSGIKQVQPKGKPSAKPVLKATHRRKNNPVPKNVTDSLDTDEDTATQPRDGAAMQADILRNHGIEVDEQNEPTIDSPERLPKNTRESDQSLINLSELHTDGQPSILERYANYDTISINRDNRDVKKEENTKPDRKASIDPVNTGSTENKPSRHVEGAPRKAPRLKPTGKASTADQAPRRAPSLEQPVGTQRISLGEFRDTLNGFQNDAEVLAYLKAMGGYENIVLTNDEGQTMSNMVQMRQLQLDLTKSRIKRLRAESDKEKSANPQSAESTDPIADAEIVTDPDILKRFKKFSAAQNVIAVDPVQHDSRLDRLKTVPPEEGREVKTDNVAEKKNNDAAEQEKKHISIKEKERVEVGQVESHPSASESAPTPVLAPSTKSEVANTPEQIPPISDAVIDSFTDIKELKAYLRNQTSIRESRGAIAGPHLVRIIEAVEQGYPNPIEAITREYNLRQKVWELVIAETGKEPYSLERAEEQIQAAYGNKSMADKSRVAGTHVDIPNSTNTETTNSSRGSSYNKKLFASRLNEYTGKQKPKSIIARAASKLRSWFQR